MTFTIDPVTVVLLGALFALWLEVFGPGAGQWMVDWVVRPVDGMVGGWLWPSGSAAPVFGPTELADCLVLHRGTIEQLLWSWRWGAVDDQQVAQRLADLCQMTF